MKMRTFGAIGVAALGLSLMVGAFITNASPYVCVAEAKVQKGDRLHLAGDIVPSSLITDPKLAETRFTLVDKKGDLMRVVYQGAPPANMGSATKVVAVGKIQNDVFQASKLLVKCPSKYETGSETTSKKGY